MNIQRAIDLADMSKVSTHSWASDKRDGVRGCIDEDHPLSTRTGNALPGFDDLNEKLKSRMAFYGIPWVDGEMYSHELSFQDIQGIVLSASAAPERKALIEYHVFAIGGDFRDTQEMIARLHHVFAGIARIKPVNYRLIRTEHAQAEMTRSLHMGYEGLMLRDDLDPHDPAGLHRLKPVKEADLKIIDIYEGKGANVGKVGAVGIKGTVDGLPVMSRAGSGLTKALREMGRSLIGKTAEIAFKEVTDKRNKEGFFSLREPSFIKLKLDR